MLTGKVVVELTDPTEIRFDRAFAEAFKMDKACVFLIPLLGSEAVMSVVFLT